ncbi:ABC transporter permease [Streptomyces rubellomurinus]|uniref:ABC transporter permease n=1 Tax=Streptomyces rubellomurinus (strain ATCC 31215) TaxID=359131 RepID=UPI0005F1DDB4|nr:ABC transporter permease [Streptomyces rubellomurinus]
MRVLAYELRRLRGLRSTWLLLAAVLVGDAAVAAVLASQTPSGPLAAPAGVRLLTAAVPLIPLPFAALGTGVLGALSYGHEVRHPGLPASQVAYPRRVRLLLAKLLVVGPVAALLALATLLLDTVAVHLALPAGVTVAARAEPGALSARVSEALGGAGLSGLDDLPGAFAPVALVAGHGVPAALLAFVLLTVVAAWTGVLTASLTRSAAAGVLLLCALPPLLESGVALLLRRTGRPWPGRAAELLPFQSGIEWAYGWVYGGTRGAAAGGAALTDPALLAAVAAPAALLLLAALLVQARRRAL